MTEGKLQKKKVFISYSWTNENHEQWVINLAERLMSDGVEVMFDKWDLKEGNDKNDFMERMVKAPDIHKVLLILDEGYTKKANSRKGGVGSEAQIISPEIYDNVSQNKFIPVVTEYDNDGKAFVPVFLKDRIYIDLSSKDLYYKNYEHLLRNIYERPAYSKPEVGTPPEYLFRESKIDSRTSELVHRFLYQIEKDKNKINSVTRDFFADYFKNLKSFNIDFTTNDSIKVGKIIVDNIEEYTGLRDDYLKFISQIFKPEYKIDIDIIIKFFERTPTLLYPENKSSWSTYEFDNFRFIIHELFLYTIGVALKNENYGIVEDLLYSSYFIEDKYSSDTTPKNFSFLNRNINNILQPYFIQTYSQKFHSPTAELIMSRKPDFIDINVIESDLICHYVGSLNRINWFPQTYIYNTNIQIDIINRIISKRYFEKVKGLYNVNSPGDLKAKLTELKEEKQNKDRYGYSLARDYVRPIYDIIEIESIASVR